MENVVSESARLGSNPPSHLPALGQWTDSLAASVAQFSLLKCRDNNNLAYTSQHYCTD